MTTLSNLQDEFTVFVTRDFGMNTHAVPLCGLCGNTGIVKAIWKPPWAPTVDAKTYEIESYCICSNGRTLRKKNPRIGRKWGGSSVTKTPDGCTLDAPVPEKEGRSLWDHVKDE